ncbi:hypothetical protein Raf01_01120 [Rugosimonospora africana]|uniref:K+-transporting ATPase KdpF subunit n=1 Tax=Rugosimonospora africana TaxID=556532 RepID=A0A8J3QJ83_9ACTN|nr:hypothetical protein Raf01_01120 [Rugosimonospora africana]
MQRARASCRTGGGATGLGRRAASDVPSQTGRRGSGMSAANIAGLILALILGVFLILALLFPERF